jgi:hypothetical protein
VYVTPTICMHPGCRTVDHVFLLLSATGDSTTIPSAATLSQYQLFWRTLRVLNPILHFVFCFCAFQVMSV